MNRKDYNNCVDKYADNVFCFILKNIKDEERARDIVQDAFERLWNNIDNINASKARSYLFSTAYHVMIDVLRKEQRLEKVEGFHEKDKGKTYNAYSDLNDILHEALNKIPEKQRSVILLRDYEGYNYKEIGEITNLNESQVKVYIYRARKALRNYIKKMDIVI
ncbi:MAG: RNA polymerase sigma factor [Flavobacteriales bacterium]